LRNSSFSPDQAAVMRAAHQEILFVLSHPLKRQVPPILAAEIAKTVAKIVESGECDRACIVARVFEEVGIRYPDAHGLKTLSAD
jgi:hypothetical protein